MQLEPVPQQVEVGGGALVHRLELGDLRSDENVLEQRAHDGGMARIARQGIGGEEDRLLLDEVLAAVRVPDMAEFLPGRGAVSSVARFRVIARARAW